MLECDRGSTNLFVLVDGDANLFLQTRQYVENSKFAERLCVQGTIPGEVKKYSVNTRRRRISAIHNAVRELLKPCDYVFLVEDDGVLPSNALKRLLSDYLTYPHAGFITGVQIGRWGVPMVGAWRADDVYEPSRFETVLQSSRELLDLAQNPVGLVPDKMVEEVDAGGLYACLTRYELYAKHEFAPYEDVLGPDVAYGVWLRRQGYMNYIDWAVPVEHRKPDGTSIHPRTTEAVKMTFTKNESGSWNGQIVEDKVQSK